MKITLVLGCWGRTHEGFSICNGVSNAILDLSLNSERNVAISEYLDSHYGLFDRPLYNSVHSAIFNIQDKFGLKGKPVFKDVVFRWMEEFCIMHAKCGLFLRLELADEE
jgi:hypothetical protein